MSDGSHRIFEATFDGNDFNIKNIHSISQQNEEEPEQPLEEINELEVVNGDLWGNVWMTNNLYVFDLSSDSVKKIIDLSHLSHLENMYRKNQGLAETNRDEVLNGIAYNAEQKTLLITGKEWNFIYEVTLLE